MKHSTPTRPGMFHAYGLRYRYPYGVWMEYYVSQFSYIHRSFTPADAYEALTQINLGARSSSNYLKQCPIPWQISFKMTVRSGYNPNDVVVEIDVQMSNEEPSSRLMCRPFANRLVQIDFEFSLLEGLGIPLLRNYQVPDAFSDVTIIVEGKKFELNRMFLATHSSYFKLLLLGKASVAKNPKEIELRDVSSESFTDLLDVLTQAVHHLNRKAAVLDVLRLAEQFDVPEVFRKMEVMLISNHPYNLLNKGEKLWLADKYHQYLPTLMLHSIESWERGDSRRFLPMVIFEDIRPRTVHILVCRRYD